MMAVKPITLARKITIQLAIYLAMIICTILIISVFMINRQMHREMSKKADFILRYNVEALAKPLWDLDNTQINKIIEHISQEDYIVRVILKDSDNNIIDQKGNLLPANNDSTKFIDTEGLEFYHKDIIYRYKDFDKNVGQLEIYIDAKKARKFLGLFILKILVLSTAFGIGLTFIIYSTIKTSMIPIRRLSYHISTMDRNKNSEFNHVKSDVIEANELYRALVRMKKHYDEYQEELEDEVTERTRQLEDYKNHLERMVENQVRDIRVAKESAEKANQAKSDFLANISHELKTPMNAIISYSRMGIDNFETLEKEKLEKYYENINKSGIKLLYILNDLLDISKLEAGRMIMNFEEGNIKNTVDEVLQEAEGLIRAKSLILSETVMTENLYCCYDKIRISQVMMNLISFAVKFSELAKPLIIGYGNGQIEQEGVLHDALAVSIENYGVGIAENELDDIFEKFFPSSRTRSIIGGTGLSLTICREIVIAHKGKIWAEMVPGGSTRISFLIPRKPI